MTLYSICPPEEVGVGQMKVFTAGLQKIVLYHLSDGFFATQASCTHLLAPLVRGKILTDGKVQCPFHHARFDIRTGAVIDWANFPPGIQLLNAIRSAKPLRTFRVSLKDSMVQVEVPS